ncbi:hypothetical protein KI387_021384, partial [Taxus chinensis]
DVTNLLTKLKEIKNQFEIMGVKVEEKSLVEITLNSLPMMYEYLITSLEVVDNIDTLTFEELSGYLLQEEQRVRRKFDETNSTEQAYISKGRFR